MELKKLRKERHISQHELARLARVPQSAISMIETGKSEPKIATVKKLASALGVHILVLLGEEVPPACQSYQPR